MGVKVLLWRVKGKLHGQATKNPAKLRKFLNLSPRNSSVITLIKRKKKT